MLTSDQIAALRDKATELTDPVLEFLLEDITRRISEAGKLTSTASYQIWHAQQLGMSQSEIKKELKKRLKVTESRMRQLLTAGADAGYDFDISRFPHVEAVPFAENAALQQILQSAVQVAGAELENLTQTIGMVDPYGNPLPLQDVYRSCCDYAFKLTTTGAADYNTAIRRATKNLADKGLRVIDYESGVHTGMEAAVRRCVMGALGLMQEQISQQNHDDFGCDGWEISAHAASAPDHEPIQGKQYSDADYTALNNSLLRRIGTLNCGHSAFPIIMGVTPPQYTPEELEKLRTDNEKGVEIDGKHYSLYEATQLQRKIERAMRRQKNRILVDETAGDKDKLLTDQIKLQRLRQEYGRVSDAAGLRTQHERAEVAGFDWKKAREAETENRKVEKLANLMYNTGSSRGNVDAWLRDKPIRDMLNSGSVPFTVQTGRQNKHIFGTHEFADYAKEFSKKGQYGPSLLTIPIEQVQPLVERCHGTGILLRSKDGRWRKQERITWYPDEIGTSINNLTGQQAPTTVFVIHYSKDGVHIVPDYPGRKGERDRG